MTNITAHRGFSKQFPENTMVAFREAIKAGADSIEMDVHFSKDKKLIVHHDYTLGRTSNGEGAIHQQESTYLHSLDAGSWFASTFVKEKLPFLDEVFKEFGTRIRYELDLRACTKEFLQAVVDTVLRFGLAEKVEFTSPHMIVFQHVRKLMPNSKTGLFVAQYPGWMTKEIGEKLTIETLRLGEFTVAHCPLAILSEDFVALLRSEGIIVHAADCNSREDLHRAFSLGVDQLSTEDIVLARELRGSLTL